MMFHRSLPLLVDHKGKPPGAPFGAALQNRRKRSLTNLPRAIFFEDTK
jgi:hypothetical protein